MARVKPNPSEKQAAEKSGSDNRRDATANGNVATITTVRFTHGMSPAVRQTTAIGKATSEEADARGKKYQSANRHAAHHRT
jgi:hypothetical protein